MRTTNKPKDAPDGAWYVTEVQRTGDAWYPWRVRGWNGKAQEPGPFSWQVPDLSGYVLSPEAERKAQEAGR